MKKFFTLIGAMLLTMSLNAQTTLKILPFSIEPGETKTVTLDLDNPDFSASNFKCDVLMPDGVTIVDDEGEYDFDYNAESGRATAKRLGGYPSAELQPDGSVRIKVISSTGKSFSGNYGAIVDIPVKASATASGEGVLKIMNQEITDATGIIQAHPATYEATVTIGSPTGVKEAKKYVGNVEGKFVKNGKIVIKMGGKEYNAIGGRTK